MNNCSFTGRLVRDPEQKTFASGSRVVRFTIAVDRKFKKADGEWDNEVAFLDCEAWDTAADTIVQRYKKGSFILITNASARTERWEKDGEKRSKIVFRCNNFELLPTLNPPPESGAEAQSEEKPAEAATTSGGKNDKAGKGGRKQKQTVPPDDEDAKDEDIPF